MGSSLKQEDGPCMKQLEVVLKQIGAERQAYHGGSFNGNHTDKCLMVSKIHSEINALPVKNIWEQNKNADF